MTRYFRSCILALSALGLLGCGGASSQSRRPVEGSTATEQPPGKAPSPASRSLPADASYLDLVRAARLLDEENLAESKQGCLLANTASGGFSLRADVQVSVRPLPSPPDGLIGRLQSASAFRVLTRWGSMGASGAPLALVTFTPLAPTATAGDLRLLVGTAEGWIMQAMSSETASGELRGPASMGQAVAWLASLPEPRKTTLLVTAEADLSMARLYDMLSRIPEPIEHVVLASVLPPDTRLPEAEEKPATLQRCEDGLPPLPEDAELGDIDPHRLLGTMEKLQPRARRCLAQARGNQAAGARLRIAIRIGPSGAVTDACLQAAEPKAPHLAHCVLEALREMPMPAPRPSGYVDAQVPLNLRPSPTTPPAPTCE